MATTDDLLLYYDSNYDVLGSWVLKPGDKILLGDRNNRIRRFCDKRAPDVNFNKIAHALPELLGNKSLSTAYECDTCNTAFGEGIETQFGYWSCFIRSTGSS